jgi:hypothetical protein
VLDRPKEEIVTDIEKEAEYVEIARRRIEAAAAQERLPV